MVKRGTGFKNRLTERFGKLTIIKDTGKSNNRRAIWLCHCDCGKEIEISAKNLINGNTKSCGCLNKEAISKRRLKNELGKKYGRLIVYKKMGNNYRGRIIWKCFCVCGRETLAIGDDLRNGHKKSCGCLQLESRTGINSHLWKGGISKMPYPQEWRGSLKNKIRERDKYICQICGKIQSDEACMVHHIDYDKYNLKGNNLISLCRSCHAKTNHKREYYKNYIQQILVNGG